MTTGKPEEKPCEACRFWLYFENEHTERCSIKGCYEKNKFRPFDPNNPKHYKTVPTKSRHAKH